MISTETIIDQFKNIFSDAKERSESVRIRGSGSKDFYGVSLEGAIVDTRFFSGITEYEPTELVLTARSGTPLSVIENTLSENNQMLAFEPPHMGPGATFGGCIASGLSGPRRASQGAVRDFILGVRLLNADGLDLQFGGKVMKNVAGFDVSRLIAGSFGTLGLILESSIKVLPKPECEHTIFFDLDNQSAINKMNELAGMPIPLSGTCFDGNRLAVRLSGSESAVKSAHQKIGGEANDENEFWRSIREQSHPFFQSEGRLYRLSLNPTAPENRYTNKLIEWNGSTRWIWNEGSLDEHQAFASQHGGYATIFRGNQSGDSIHKMSRELRVLQKKIKHAMDPQGVFGRKRLFAEF
ncbi:MAG: glycolate oxidase subunit GlcE [Proteobacteria bacterium]|nr:glycolate oxidase subunit GlcE [Pseudomonadota bacterium]MDA1332440.1 glycolate oxidase subunit GlcE [Pseudomonadota bacterium]